MKSHVTLGFSNSFKLLPKRVKRLAQKNYAIWKENTAHPSLNFKKVGQNTDSWSVRVGLGYRALGVKDGDVIIWFWIGTHAQYDQLISSL